MRIGTRLTLAFLPLAASLFLPAAAQAWPGPDPGDPFTMSAGRVGCDGGHVRVTLRNQTRQLARFDLRADSVSVATGSIPARKSVTRGVRVRRGDSVEIEAYSVRSGHPDTLIDSTRVRNGCSWHSHGYLPYTGPPTDLVAKLATAGGLMLTGVILWWYSSLWPRGGYRPGTH
ncbi:hypothetical protein [Nonomuraea rhizosphaerae]|uniref:hypothetical protein n=1 Tax=Nonomuraea rhizosphaerae TaxID=2665663 RepID=UPI001C5FCF8C|nr:hypothetical protein [Nonomuraea rhizosphaerae]